MREIRIEKGIVQKDLKPQIIAAQLQELPVFVRLHYPLRRHGACPLGGNAVQIPAKAEYGLRRAGLRKKHPAAGV